jgi:hypothetical protein
VVELHRQRIWPSRMAGLPARRKQQLVIGGLANNWNITNLVSMLSDLVFFTERLALKAGFLNIGSYVVPVSQLVANAPVSLCTAPVPIGQRRSTTL